MGADLTIKSIAAAQEARYGETFAQWVRVRNQATDPVARARAQRQVAAAYAQLTARGAFRDPYNASSLLWRFALSWWDDVVPLLDEQKQLVPAQAQVLLQRLEAREPHFERNLAQLVPTDCTSHAAVVHWYRGRYAALQAFLREAIALGEPIQCSL